MKQAAAFILILLLSWFIFAGSILPGPITKSAEKSDLQIYFCSGFYPQERTKYLYVGMEKCASVCHNNKEMGFQYDIVKNSHHADAFRILLTEKAVRIAKKTDISEDPAESQICLKCHVTGAGLDSTFFAATYNREDGVTCEACHKSEFNPKTVIPKEEDCLKCHNDSVHKITKFDYSENCKKIAHSRPKSKIKTT
jgi:Cytochrome c554 and c-prime